MFVSKDIRGNWCATSAKELGNKRRLNLRTAKNSNGHLVTSASVCITNGIWERHKLYEDFSIVLERTQPKRVTAKVVEEQHLNHDLEQIAENAIAFYERKDHANIS